VAQVVKKLTPCFYGIGLSVIIFKKPHHRSMSLAGRLQFAHNSASPILIQFFYLLLGLSSGLFSAFSSKGLPVLFMSPLEKCAMFAGD